MNGLSRPARTLVGTGGTRTRYQADRYDSIWNERTSVNLSGTAIIKGIDEFITVSNTRQSVFEAVFKFSDHNTGAKQKCRPEGQKER